MKKVLSSLWLSAALLASSTVSALAAASEAVETQINLKPNFWPDIENLSIPGLISGVIKIILIVAALAFFFMLIIGGIQWIISGGDKQATENARNRITAALVGLVIVFSAWAIASLIGYFFGINIFELTFPTI